MEESKTIASGTLLKTGDVYTVALMAASQIDPILALHNTVYADLPSEQKDYLAPKDRMLLEEHFGRGHLVLGIMSNARLIAQGLIVNPTQAYPETGLPDIASLNLTAPVESLSAFKSVVVHPDFRGNGLQAILIDAFLSIAQEAGRTQAVTYVTVENDPSWKNFLKQGMRIRAIGVDNSDGSNVYYMHARAPFSGLTAVFNEASAVRVPSQDLGAQKNLLTAGYQGVRYDTAERSLVFKRAVS